ncbi:F0F1 ATP synthase subunit delta [Propionibacterium australiense]|uniref:ATP synthase subunit delta n=1 Tax=Propionibacterium australiense TaxID=119981 RepID=A0A383S357_9ACTN|nr:F0F1 ATP synthase subunit delta [Propionibacterium australiense]RLP11645.1 hypothetical protein D9T14_03340 [Propionibacterium australiense]RLP12158.1 hypothetical protein D7U36_02525 [Propionibacterium australiense]SYZ32377.1 ATPase, OSCP/delta subunit [Propionibacterium australiense]VEH90335.1 ATP synthase subunit b-delta [Propionibacterium australiense]
MAENRFAALDAAAGGLTPDATLVDDLFQVVEALRANPQLRRALTDTSLAAAARGRLAERLFGQRIGSVAVDLLATAAAMDWRFGLELADALERQGVRSAVRSGDPATVRDELGACARLIGELPQIEQALSAHGSGPEQRSAFVTRLFGPRISAATLLLVQHAARRGGRVGRTIAGYEEIASAVLGRLLARVTVARALPADQAERLSEQLARVYATPVDLSISIDPEVLGGVLVRVGDEVIDGTIATTLDQARRQLA